MPFSGILDPPLPNKRVFKVYPMSWTILISFDSIRGFCAIIEIAQAEDDAKQGEIQFDHACGQLNSRLCLCTSLYQGFQWSIHNCP